MSAAARYGCDVVAITDHGDGGLKGGTPEYAEAIWSARVKHTNITVLTAMEWNVPPGKGQEHATILFPTDSEAASTLSAFKEQFDDQVKEGENPELALKGFDGLMPKDKGAPAPVVFFNHPSRRPNSTSAPKLTFAQLHKSASSILVGFEGAPGHQRGIPLGAYPSGLLVDRWDPLAAEVGGAWDQWLQQGMSVWAAIANSDFHSEQDDFWPCEFAATWVYAPDRTVNGIIRAIRAGSFFAEHGHIAERVELQARFDGQPHVFQTGETAAASPGTKATVALTLRVPQTDYRGRPNRIDSVELIGVSRDGAQTLFSGPPGASEAFSTVVTVPAEGLVLRARGRRALEGEPALMFYTNPIRVTAGRR